MTRRNNAVRGLLAVAALALLAGCNSNNGGSNSAARHRSGERHGGLRGSGAAQLNGAGGTFPQPLYAKWFQEYGQKNGVTINYQPIGSGGGIKAITAKTVDFGASDAPMNDKEMQRARRHPAHPHRRRPRHPRLQPPRSPGGSAPVRPGHRRHVPGRHQDLE